MADNRANDNDSKAEGVDDSEEENEILEESPCGRWLKRKEEVEQRDIPGIDATYLAMDTEEGVEVVWNEVRFSERKYFKAKEDKINEVFDRLIQLEHPNIRITQTVDRLIQLEHPNIVKLHKYWLHKDIEKPRVIFITEYMSSGSLKQFLRRTKRSLIKMALNAWRRWCTQTLSALCYLHTSQPPIVHANLNCDTIFISYNGLIKIGAVAPDAIHKHVKTVRGESKMNLHFIAPEIGCITDTNSSVLSPAVDIYSFGMCALEMAALEISANGDSATVTEEVINSTIESLENKHQKDFITRCLYKDPKLRPTARELLFHPIIFEVPSLRLFAAHVIVNTPSYLPEQLTEEAIARVLCLQNNSDRVLAEVRHDDSSRPNVLLKQSDSPKMEFEKFFEEVRNGSCPLTAIVTTIRPPLICRQRTMSPEMSSESTKQLNSPDNPYDEESRRIHTINSTLEPLQEASDKRLVISLHIVFDDKINRKLSTKLDFNELEPSSLAQELVFYGFVNKEDKNTVFELLSETKDTFATSGNQSTSCQKTIQLPQPQPQLSKPVMIQSIQQPIQSQQTKQQNVAHNIPAAVTPTNQQSIQQIPVVIPQQKKSIQHQIAPQIQQNPTLNPQQSSQTVPQQSVAQTQTTPQQTQPSRPVVIQQPIQLQQPKQQNVAHNIPAVVTPTNQQSIQPIAVSVPQKKTSIQQQNVPQLQQNQVQNPQQSCQTVPQQSVAQTQTTPQQSKQEVVRQQVPQQTPQQTLKQTPQQTSQQTPQQTPQQPTQVTKTAVQSTTLQDDKKSTIKNQKPVV
ncbi:unnamed protein product [Medioppia subpectinata]|uniref:Protein kinase domain-containing protein n=1 Tax=Medioppia subpectinata TaxID=1979941 RepID=A0A7R9KQ15_9ACAR|nr:unnamed protein product [Medioppia subpectinata]CAG2107697.1 unnamed protein product [Medioppia subpectinata]